MNASGFSIHHYNLWEKTPARPCERASVANITSYFGVNGIKTLLLRFSRSAWVIAVPHSAVNFVPFLLTCLKNVTKRICLKYIFRNT